MPTGELNRVLAEAQAAPPLARRAGSSTPPRGRPTRPTFTLFATKAIPAPYLRYLERRIREHFGFGPTPLKFRVRRRTELTAIRHGPHRAGSRCE